MKYEATKKQFINMFTDRLAYTVKERRETRCKTKRYTILSERINELSKFIVWLESWREIKAPRRKTKRKVKRKA